MVTVPLRRQLWVKVVQHAQPMIRKFDRFLENAIVALAAQRTVNRARVSATSTDHHQTLRPSSVSMTSVATASTANGDAKKSASNNRQVVTQSHAMVN